MHLRAMFAAATVAASMVTFAVRSEKMDTILAAHAQGQAAGDFEGFAQAVAAEIPAPAPAVEADGDGAVLDRDALIDVDRPLGIRIVLVNGEANVTTLGALVQDPTFRLPDVAPYETPAIFAIGALIEGLSDGFGLAFRNGDDRISGVTVPGSGDEQFGILTHSDVPANAEEWVLDGQQFDPFELNVIDGVMDGRGTIDDKRPITAALYSMKAVQDSSIPLQRGVHPMIETSEETGGDGMDYYRESNDIPEYNTVFASRCPAVLTEKRGRYVRAYFQEGERESGGNAITGTTGAPALNAVPATAGATIRAEDQLALADQLLAARIGFIAAHPSDGDFETEISGDVGAGEVFVAVWDASAHSSRPEEGVSPVARLTVFLLESTDLADNAWRRAGEYIEDVYGTGYLGEKLGVGNSDDFMGPLTVVPTYFNEADGKIEVAANLRIPRCRTANLVEAMVADKLAVLDGEKGWNAEYAHSQGEWMARDPSGAWLGTLLGMFGDTTGLTSEPIPTAGSTTAKQMPIVINFGLSMPGFKYTSHGALENHLVAHLHNDMHMFSEMQLRIGTLPQIQ